MRAWVATLCFGMVTLTAPSLWALQEEPTTPEPQAETEEAADAKTDEKKASDKENVKDDDKKKADAKKEAEADEKKKEEVHRMAEANKAFSHFRF